MSELHSQGAGSAGGHDSADVGSETERPSRPVNQNGQESWAEDAEPLTRGEYADQVRQQLAAREHDSVTGPSQGLEQSNGRADAEDGQEQEDLPEPRTRQEVGGEARSPDAIHGRDHADNVDAGLDTSSAAEVQLPESRTRQEVAEEARSGVGPLTSDATTLPDHPAKSTAENPPSELEQHAPCGQVQGDDPPSGFTVVQADAADRTLGDTTPTGIGLKPTGDQLMKMENEEASKPEQLRRKFLEGIDDLNDSARENASLGHDLLTRHHPPAGHAVTEVPHPLPEMSDGGLAPDITSAGLVTGILLVEATRLARGPIHRIAEAAKGHRPWR